MADKGNGEESRPLVRVVHGWTPLEHPNSRNGNPRNVQYPAQKSENGFCTVRWPTVVPCTKIRTRFLLFIT
jgi:hypothetical protein